MAESAVGCSPWSGRAGVLPFLLHAGCGGTPVRVFVGVLFAGECYSECYECVSDGVFVFSPFF